VIRTITMTFAAATLLAGVSTPALAQASTEGAFVQREDRPNCTMDQLKAASAAYVEGQGRGSLSALPLHDRAEYLENMQTIDPAAGLWNTSLPIAHSMSFHDPVRCKTFSEVIVTEGGHPYVIGTRLYLHDGKVIRVDSLVTDADDWLFNANAYLRYSSVEDWGPLFKYQLTPLPEMIHGANAYLDGFSDKFVETPWGTPCARLEGGAYTDREGDPHASCEVGMPDGVLYINNRDYLIDPEMGVINVFCRFGNSEEGMPDSHTFRLIDGKIRAVHTLSVNTTGRPSPPISDEGAILR